MGTCNRTIPSKGQKMPCCRTVMFVGMCGKWAKVLRKFPFKLTCPKLGCTVVVDHVAKPASIKTADLVIFSHIAGYLSKQLWDELLKQKHDKQRWVFSTIESPVYVRGLLPPWILRNDTYDFADTFYSDADVSTPYGYYEPFRIGLPKVPWNFSELMKDKNKLISWTASHCETLQWDRKKFVFDLDKILPVDTYGKCNTWDDKCVLEYEKLMKSYKFSLSLENSCCHEYITEKFWKMLELGNVPVVIGPPIKDFEHLAPPGSFIHADQFESMEDLADYLRYLDKNTTAYMEYFSWRTKGRVVSDTTPEHYKRSVSDETICQLVGFLLEETKDDSVQAPRRKFDVYSSLWQDRCETCGHHEWLKRYEFPPEHKRRSSSLWA
ncbi:Alpha-(1,3)-fucosyltransferase 4 [Holothuria leucospilota]|uniref:Fucosyltransferase n=1 Tax=Holothuria leucospilota TaxID=206669 RepID=A0A9Q1HGF6_HOLLE|nr:Alpha-(1,3)-fucosyltransferase 4 [Holothuria leucospilota]